MSLSIDSRILTQINRAYGLTEDLTGEPMEPLIDGSIKLVNCGRWSLETINGRACKTPKCREWAAPLTVKIGNCESSPHSSDNFAHKRGQT